MCSLSLSLVLYIQWILSSFIHGSSQIFSIYFLDGLIANEFISEQQSLAERDKWWRSIISFAYTRKEQAALLISLSFPYSFLSSSSYNPFLSLLCKVSMLLLQKGFIVIISQAAAQVKTEKQLFSFTCFIAVVVTAPWILQPSQASIQFPCCSTLHLTSQNYRPSASLQ